MSFLHAMQQVMTGPSGPEVSMNATNCSRVRFNADCYSGVRFAIDGDEDKKGPTNGWADANRGQWLDQGASSEVWVQRTINTGSLNDEDAGSGRLQLDQARAFSIIKVGVGTVTCNLTFDMYDAASGGNLLDTVTIDIIAEVSN